MNFLYYSQETNLPVIEGQYEIIADGSCFAYKYSENDDMFLAIRINNDKYALFQIENNMSRENCLDTIHNILYFYRETIGTMGSPLTTEITREIQTLYNTNDIVFFAQDEELEEEKTITYKIIKKRVNDTDYWYIKYGQEVLLSTCSERLIRRVAVTIWNDIRNYVLQRWRIR